MIATSQANDIEQDDESEEFPDNNIDHQASLRELRKHIPVCVEP
jgi:hypothetical protein